MSRIVAIANLLTSTSSAGKTTQVRGADALNVPLGLTTSEVLADLDALESLLALPPPETLKILEQLTAVKNPELKKSLDMRLSGVPAMMVTELLTSPSPPRANRRERHTRRVDAAQPLAPPGEH